MRFFLVLPSLLSFVVSVAQGIESLPGQPKDPLHPGSAAYLFQSKSESFSYGGRTVTLYTPVGITHKVPLVVWGHGHTVPLFGYSRTLDHLARKGIASVFPSYDTGWSDTDYERMARDYMGQVAAVLKKRSDLLDPNAVVFSGHSNGAFVALLAAGLPAPEMLVQPRAVVAFALAGARDEYLARLNPSIAVSLVVGDKDDKTPASYSLSVYNRIRIQKKQLIVLSSYRNTSPELVADHGLSRTWDWTTGQRETPLHFYGVWKYLVGAAWDIQQGSPFTNPYLYGAQAPTTGLSGLSHAIKKNW